MKAKYKTAIASGLLAAFTSSAALAHGDTPFNKAEECFISELNQTIGHNAGTAETVDIYLTPLQEKCERKTEEKIQHMQLLGKGPSDFRAGGTQFIFK